MREAIRAAAIPVFVGEEGRPVGKWTGAPPALRLFEKLLMEKPTLLGHGFLRTYLLQAFLFDMVSKDLYQPKGTPSPLGIYPCTFLAAFCLSES